MPLNSRLYCFLRRGLRVTIFPLLGLGFIAPVVADIPPQFAVHRHSEPELDPRDLPEEQVVFPAWPSQADLVEFVVSAATDNHFFIDSKALSIGKDGVVRYTLVIKTPGGAVNTSFEGIRCSTASNRIYATGRPDGTWAPSRNEEWQRIENKSRNRHHAALFSEYLCQLGGQPVNNVAEAVRALKQTKQNIVP